MDENFAKKRVDESWKEAVQKEKGREDLGAAEAPPASADFAALVTSLGLQAMAALGEIPDPAGGEKKTDAVHARYWIDTLQMLSDKTKGNLSEEENALIRNLLYELHVKFVKKTKAA